MISEAFPKRILGSGTAAMTVSAIGFGAMGTTYHRGVAPEKKSLLSLFARAVELGCTFFDTAAVYGPFTNELLVGEALEPFRNHVQIATKLDTAFMRTALISPGSSTALPLQSGAPAKHL